MALGRLVQPGSLPDQQLPQLPAVDIPGSDPALRRQGCGVARRLTHAHAGGDDPGGPQGVELRAVAPSGGQEVIDAYGHQRAVGDLRPVPGIRAQLHALRGHEGVHHVVVLVLGGTGDGGALRRGGVDMADGGMEAGGGHMGVEHLRPDGDAVVKLPPGGQVDVPEDIFPDDAAGVPDAVHGGQILQHRVLEAGDVFPQEIHKDEDLPVLVHDLPGEVLHIVAAAVEGVGGVQGHVRAGGIRASGHGVYQVARAEDLIQISLFQGLELLGDDQVPVLPLVHGLPPFRVRLPEFLLVHVGQAEAHGDGLAQAHVFRAAGLRGDPGGEGQVRVPGAVDEDPARHLHLAGFAVDDDGGDPPVLHLAVADVGAVEDAAARRQKHLLHHHLARLRVDGGQVGLHEGIALFLHFLQEFQGIAVHVSRHAGDITVGVQSPQGLPPFQHHDPLPVPGGRQARAETRRTAAAYHHVRVEALGNIQHFPFLPCIVVGGIVPLCPAFPPYIRFVIRRMFCPSRRS